MAGHFFSPLANRRLLVVFTDGESQKLSLYLQVTLQRRVAIVFVHMWRPDERIFYRRRADPNYGTNPTSTSLLAQAAKLTGGTAVDESRFGFGEIGMLVARDWRGRSVRGALLAPRSSGHASAVCTS